MKKALIFIFTVSLALLVIQIVKLVDAYHTMKTRQIAPTSIATSTWGNLKLSGPVETKLFTFSDKDLVTLFTLTTEPYLNPWKSAGTDEFFAAKEKYIKIKYGKGCQISEQRIMVDEGLLTIKCVKE